MATFVASMSSMTVENDAAIPVTTNGKEGNQISNDSKNLQQRILSQVEYYFSDTNIINDAFLLDLIDKDPEGWVDLNIIADFNKMKKLTDSIEVIIDSIKKSKLLTVCPSKKAMRRINPLPSKETFEKRTILLSGPLSDDCRKVKQLKAKLDQASLPFQSIRNFPPYVNITEDLRSAFDRHKLIEKKFFMIVFDNSENADSALKYLRKLWPNAYSNLLCHSWKPRPNQRSNGITSQSNQSKSSRKQLDPMPLLTSTSNRPRLKILLPDPNRPVVILSRLPVIPPAEESVGFETGWKDKLHEKQLQHLPKGLLSSLDSLSSLHQSTSTSCDFEDPAVVNYVK